MINSADIRVPLRPLSRILPARARGENADVIERENIRKRHDAVKEDARLRAQSRLAVLAIIFVCLYGVVAVRMGMLSASDAAEPRSAVSGSAIVAQRADIVDRKGRILATNFDTHSLYVEVPHLVDPEMTARELVKIFPDLDYNRLIKDFTGSRKFLWIKKRLSAEQMQAAHDIGDPGLRFGPREMRLYPNGRLASHVLGGASFGKEGVHAAEIVGVAGVEKTFDTKLRDPAQSNSALRLSLDLSVQAAIEQVLDGGMKLLGARGAAAILMDVHTGEVISLASLPDFDPNHRPRPPVQGQAADSPLFNRAVQGVYELGSTFKILTVAQAMELDLVTPETIVDTTGPIRWGRHKINDDHKYGNTMPVWKVISKSSNVGTARIAQMIGPDRHREFLIKLGFSEAVPFEMIEASGGKPLLPPKWSELSTMTISYGHGLSATPLHLAAAYAAIANGGYKVQPSLLYSPNAKVGERVLSEKTAANALKMLRGVVTDGTATMAEVAGYSVAGKTGTADKPSATGGYESKKVMATFASVFPSYNPKYVLVVSLDEPEDRSGSEPRRSAGWTAAPISGEIIGRIAPLLGLRPQIENSDNADITQVKWN